MTELKETRPFGWTDEAALAFIASDSVMPTPYDKCNFAALFIFGRWRQIKDEFPEFADWLSRQVKA